MAASITTKNSTVPGASVQLEAVVALDTSYPNPAGYVFTAASFGLSILKKFIGLDPMTLAAGIYTPVVIPTYNADNTIASFALHLIIGTTGVEVANAVNVSTSSFLMIVEGN